MKQNRPFIRDARESDRDQVLRFSQNTWEWGDYIAFVWDRWLTEPNSKTLVATIAKQPVAFGHAVIVAPGEAWLEGLRVDPAYRRKGLAKLMTRRSLHETYKMGASIIRFATLSSNTPVHHIAAETGFTNIASFLPGEAEAVNCASTGLSVPDAIDLPRLWSFIESSRTLQASGRLFSDGWRFHSMRFEDIRDALAAGTIRAIQDRGEIQAVAIIEHRSEREGLVVSFADGKSEQLGNLAKGLRVEAGCRNLPVVRTRLPEYDSLQESFAREGYHKTDGSFWIFEHQRSFRTSSAGLEF